MPPREVEAVKGFFDSRPCNVRHGSSPVGSSKWSREVSDRKYFVEHHIPGFAQFERWCGKNVLEIGCGIGTDTLSFLQYGATVDAVDLSPESLTLAKTRCRYFLGERARFFEMNAEEHLPYYSDYDFIYAFGVLHHTPHPEKVLAHAHAALKPGGELRIMVYAWRSLKNFLREQPEAQPGCPLARTYTRRAIRKLVTDAGFQVESIRQDHIFPYRVADYVEYRYVRRWPYRLMPEALFHSLEKVLGWHLLVTARKI